MQDYQKQFIDFAITQGALKFGDFTLKSGRISPYFFNAGLFNSGQALAHLGRYYAQSIINHGLEFDILFGPAYKGIPLAVATAVALADHHALNIPWCFNRKETKDHGEGGSLVGAPLKGRVLIIDDVMTAGTAVREAMKLITDSGARAVGVAIALDRMEKGANTHSAIREVESEFDLSVITITDFSTLVEFMQQSEQYATYLDAMNTYREQYGI